MAVGTRPPPLPPATPELPAVLEPVPPTPAERRSRPPPALVVAAVGVGLVFAAPLGYLVWRNAVLGGDVVALLRSSTTLGPLGRTVLLATTVSAACAALGTSVAWVVTRADLPGRRVWRALVPLPLVIPSFVGAAALVAGLAPGGALDQLLGPLGVERLPPVRGFVGAFGVLTLLSYPYVSLPVAARLAVLPPTLEESARLLGRRPWGVFRTVVLPQTAGAVWAGGLLVFLYVLSDFGAVDIVRYDTLTRDIFANRVFNPQRSVALSLVLGALAVAVVAAERVLARRRVVTAAAGGARALTLPLGRWKAPALGLVGATVGLGLVAPLAVLGWWAVRGLLRSDAALRVGEAGLADLVGPVANTAGAGVVTAVVAVAVVLPVAFLTVRHRSHVGDLPNAMVVGGFALPGLVIALALAFWALRLPAAVGLYQTLPLLVVAYVVHFGAQAMRAAQVAVGGVPPQLEDAARTLGAGRVRRLATVSLPLMLPGLGAGAGLVLLSAMKELPATLLLAPTGFETLATRIWGANDGGFLAEVGLTSLVLVALSGALTWLLVIRRADRL
ncbi:MAG: ABC transporter permease [Acidimicrobiales bacterium]